MSRIDWPRIEQEILARIDIRAEYEALGMVFTSDRPSSSGWLEGRSLLRDDENPSAAVNIASNNGSLGKFTDLGDTENAISLWEAASRLQPSRFANWQQARAYYADRAGVQLPNNGQASGARRSAAGRPAQLAEDQLHRLPRTPANIRTACAIWSQRKGGFSACAVAAADPHPVHWPARGRNNCIAFPAYKPDNREEPAGWILYRKDGQPFPAGGGLKERKCHRLRGSQDGLIILGGWQALDAAETVWLCEGLPDALALHDHLPPGHVAVSNVNSGSIENSLVTAFRSKNLIVAADCDRAGQQHARRKAFACLHEASEVKIVPPWVEVTDDHGRDLRDYLQNGGTFETLFELIQEADAETADSLGNIKPEIYPSTDEQATVNQAVAALAQVDGIFQRAAKLVEIQEEPHAPESASPVLVPRIKELKTSVIRTKLSAAASFLKQSADGPMEMHPPDWCVKSVADLGGWRDIPVLEGIVTSPVLRRDGSILTRPGYDRRTGLFYKQRHDLDLPGIPDRPTQEDAASAAAALKEIVTDFPFITPAHQSAWLSGVLTPLARFAYRGATPPHVFDANVAGTGKSLLVDSTFMIIAGTTAPRTPLPPDEKEMRKAISTYVLGGDQQILFDNVEGKFGGAALDAAVTSEVWNDRRLGGNEVIQAPMRLTFYATTNNLQFAGDMSRRALVIRLECFEENPEERSDFTHPNLLQWVESQRGGLLSAALTILRAYCVAGRPDVGLQPWGSFDAWSELVRGAIVWAGESDPIHARQDVLASADTKKNVLRLAIEAWEEFTSDVPFTTQGRTISEALRCLERTRDEFPDPYPKLREAFDEMAGSNGKPNARSVGNRFRYMRRRVCGGKFLDTNDAKSEHGTLWQVFQVDEMNSFERNYLQQSASGAPESGNPDSTDSAR